MNEKEKKAWSRGFNQGFATACAITIRNHGYSIEVCDTYRCNFMTSNELKKSGVDNDDILILQPAIKECEAYLKAITK